MPSEIRVDTLKTSVGLAGTVSLNSHGQVLVGITTVETLVASTPFFANSQTVTKDYTVSSTTNALSAGPITVNNGVTVIVQDGGNWVIV
jgi:hypothetical protein